MQGTRVAIVGAGLIGRAWAISFARGGCAVALFDAEPSAVTAALAAIEALLADLAAHSLLGGQDPATLRGRIAGAPSLQAALANAVHVQENTPETVEAKRAVFAALDAAAPPGAVLASSSSGILPSLFTGNLAGRARCLVAHPINPPYLVPAVELVPAAWTDPACLERTRALMTAIGQAPIVMARELDGFIMNRLQGALLHEAFRLVAEGYASPEDVDIGIRDGLGRRWAFMGPFETIDLNAPGGIADYVARYEPLYQRISAPARPVPWAGPLLDHIAAQRRAALPAAELAERQRWRDRRLMELAAGFAADTEPVQPPAPGVAAPSGVAPGWGGAGKG